MFISEIFTTSPPTPRGELETKTYDILAKLQIPYERVDNDAVEGMEECVEISDKLGAEIRKSIFLCNRQKTVFYLLIMPAEKHFDTKKFCEALSCPRVSFASADLMRSHLGVLPGTASVMSVLNDEASLVKVVIDKEVADSEWFACNPGANTSHIKIKTSSLIENLLPAINHKAVIIDL